MSNELEELRSARDRIDPGWDAPQMERVLDRVHRRLRAHRIRQRALGALAIAATIAVAIGGGVHYGRRTAPMAMPTPAAAAPPATPSPSAAPASPEESVMRYPDGSAAFSTAPGTRLQIDEAMGDRVVTSLDHGAARFEVVPDHDREFRVRIETVTVTVLGTIFAVDRGEGSVHVAVRRGRVRVESPGLTTVLEAGDEGDYPFAVGAAGNPSAAASTALASPAAESWRALARRGRHRDAYALMHGLRPTQAKDAEELLAAADVARLSGHPSEALPFLERVLSDFHGDSRAPLAAFGIGRILLPSAPAGAASRFAEARALAPNGAIAEDALAREVEAWSRAGIQSKAHAAAVEYLRRYPQGSRVDQVRAMGGI
jgi:transmembrane sensor